METSVGTNEVLALQECLKLRIQKRMRFTKEENMAPALEDERVTRGIMPDTCWLIFLPEITLGRAKFPIFATQTLRDIPTFFHLFDSGLV